MYSLGDQELEGEEESLLHWQKAARAEAHWDETGTDGEESEGELEMTEGEHNVELGGNPSLYYADWRCSPTN